MAKRKTKQQELVYVPEVYLTVDSPDAFVDFPERVVNERGAAKHPIPEGEVQCPACKGYGGHNLKLRAYPLHDYADTPENRHLFSNFRSSCSQCWGWGHVPTSETACIHEYGRGRSLGRCLNEWVCSKCGKTLEVDSSD